MQNKLGKSLLGVLILVAVICIVVGVVITRLNKEHRLLNPIYISHDFSTYEQYEKTLLNSYIPNLDWRLTEKTPHADAPEILGTSALLVNLESGDLLFAKDATAKRPIASLVKIMTAVVALEHKPITDEVLISAESASIGENTMNLSTGELYTLEELLYGLVLHSGNDAAYALAQYVAGDNTTFVEWMNIKAQELELKNTYFADPSGLDNSSYSTSEDLVRLTRYALKNPNFRRIVKTVELNLVSDTHKFLPLYNQTNLLTTYPGVAGVKTGYTEEAGLCLVTYAENEGIELIGVVLNSPDRKGDMVKMLDFGFGAYGITVEHNLLE